MPRYWRLSRSSRSYAPRGSLDLSSLIKPELARGELQCIGATTFEEYRKHIEADSALERRFQPVMVSEPTIDQTSAILRGRRGRYAQHHGVAIDDDAIEAAANLSARYIVDRFLPDKAIDLMDEASASVSLAGRTPARVTVDDVAVNREMIQVYWDIGRLIVERREREGWGKGIVDRLAKDIQKAVPGLKGFSPSNVWRMRSFYLAYTKELAIPAQPVRELDGQNLPQAVAEIPWGHNACFWRRPRTRSSASGTPSLARAPALW